MKDWRKYIVFWGWLDLATFLGYCLKNIIKNKIPFFADIALLGTTLEAFGLSSFEHLIAVLLLGLYLSLLVSGYYLVRKKKIGVILGFCQIPIRLFAIIPPSASLLFWLLIPSKYVVFTIITITAIELFKWFTFVKFLQHNKK